MAGITGDDGKDDTLLGSDGADEISGLGGNDRLVGGAGKDILNGGGGNDYLEAGGFGDPALNSTVYGSAADDVLNGGAGNDTAYLDYSDLVNEATNKPIEITYVFGTNSQIQIQGFTGATITDVENIFIKLADGDDDVTLGGGNDTVWGGYGDDVIKTGDGNDVVYDVGGLIDFDGGKGTDLLRLDWRFFTWAMTVDLESGEIRAYGTDAPADHKYGTAVGFERLDQLGSAGMDTVYGGEDADQFTDYAGGAYFDGRGGNDVASLGFTDTGTLIGGEGNDTLSGKYGSVFLDGGGGNDTLIGASNVDDTLHGGEGDDVIYGEDGGNGFQDDDIDAGGGNDIVYAGFNFGGNDGTAVIAGGAGTDRLIIGLGANRAFDAQTDQGKQVAGLGTISGFESFEITGGDGSFGSSGADGGDTIATLGGKDVLRGLDGADTLNGRGGDDILDGGKGADSLIGGDGNDTVTYFNSFVANIINLTDPSGNSGDAAGDTYSGVENVIGGVKADVIIGNAQNNKLSGGDGTELFEGDGNDTLDGGDGIDTAVFKHNFAKYTIVEQEDGSYLVTDKTPFDGNGTDTLIDIEKAQFADRTIDLSNPSGGNSPPKGLKLSATALDENAAAGTLVGKLSARDADKDPLTYSLTDDAGGAFALQGSKLVSTRSFDYEATQSLKVKVEVSDGTDSVSKSFTIAIRDLLEEVRGTAKANDLKGGIGADEMIGLAGNDRLTGGRGNDVFVFSTGFDKDTITDFDGKDAGNDRVDLSGLKSIASFTDLRQNHLSEKGADVVIDGGGGDVLVLQNVAIGDLAKGDFIF